MHAVLPVIGRLCRRVTATASVTARAGRPERYKCSARTVPESPLGPAASTPAPWGRHKGYAPFHVESDVRMLHTGSVSAVGRTHPVSVSQGPGPACTEATVEVDRSEGDVNLSPAREAWQQHHVTDEDTLDLLKDDADVFLHQTLSTPCLNGLSAVSGSTITDVAGRDVLDFHGNSVHQVGFGNPAVIEAITRQMQELSFCTRRYTNRPAVELARKLVDLAPGSLSRVLFTPSGAASIGVALKLARLATGRHKTVSMWDSFHGAGLDTISIGGESVFRKGMGPLLPGTSHVPPCDEYRCLYKCRTRGGCDLSCAEYIDYIFEREGDVGAVIAEPMRWTPYIPPAEYWRHVKDACERHGALLIFDEIPNSLGRSGSMFTCERFVTPDILVVGKGLGGGILPLSAVIASEELNEVCKTAALGHYTHEKNPVLCAAGLATLNYIEEHDLCANAAKMGEYALELLAGVQERQPLVGDVRGVGLLLGIELVRDRLTQERAVDEAEAVMYKCLSKGLSFKVTMGNIVTFAPPLTVTATEMERAVGILEESLAEVQAES